MDALRYHRGVREHPIFDGPSRSSPPPNAALGPPPVAVPRRGRSGAPAFHVALFLLTGITLAGCWALLFAGSAPWRLDVGAPYAVAVLAILGAHEMGHWVACRIHGIRATLPYFIPGFPLGTFGAVIRIRAPIPDRRALFDVAAAGPIAGFAVALPILIHGIVTAVPQTPLPPGADEAVGMWHFGHSLLSRGLIQIVHGQPGDVLVGPSYVAAWFGLLVTSMNLFPVGQLDGGHVAFSISRRLHRTLSWATVLGLATWVASYSIVQLEMSGYLLWTVVLLFLRDRHPPVLDRGPSIGPIRAAVAVGLAMLFVVTFMPVPIGFE